MTLKKQVRNNREQYILEKFASLKNYNNFCLKNIKIIYTVIDESVSQLISGYITDKSAVKVVMLRSNNSTQAKTVYIKNEQEFVHKFLENLPEKPLKLTYKDK